MARALAAGATLVNEIHSAEGPDPMWPAALTIAVGKNIPGSLAWSANCNTAGVLGHGTAVPLCPHPSPGCAGSRQSKPPTRPERLRARFSPNDTKFFGVIPGNVSTKGIEKHLNAEGASSTMKSSASTSRTPSSRAWPKKCAPSRKSSPTRLERARRSESSPYDDVGRYTSSIRRSISRTVRAHFRGSC